MGALGVFFRGLAKIGPLLGELFRAGTVGVGALGVFFRGLAKVRMLLGEFFALWRYQATRPRAATVPTTSN